MSKARNLAALLGGGAAGRSVNDGAGNGYNATANTGGGGGNGGSGIVIVKYIPN